MGRIGRRLAGWGAGVVIAAGVAGGVLSDGAQARTAGGELPTVALAELPREAQAIHRRILQGGPFRYEKDGTTFFNRERLLPAAPRGFYREYTVRTPGVSHRGARRIVCGGDPPERPLACYYTADHYASFSRIVP